MINFTNKRLYSQDLTFRLLEEQDKRQLFSILQDKNLTIPAGFLPPTSADYDEFWNNLTCYSTGIAILLDGKCIGYYHVNNYRPDEEQYKNQTNIAIGFVLDSKHHKKGYATQTLTTLNAYLLQNFDNVWADYFVENVASQKTLQKCGFRKVCEYQMEFDGIGTKHIISTVISRNH